MGHKYREKWKEICEFLDVEKAYDMDECGVENYLVRNVSSQYDGSIACVILGKRGRGQF